jgi:hypothetical protein
MNETTAKLHTRQDVCAIRRRGRTAQIADENSGRWPAPTMYRGRTPLWTTEEVERGLAQEMAELTATAEKMRAQFKASMQGCIKARRQKSEALQHQPT